MPNCGSFECHCISKTYFLRNKKKNFGIQYCYEKLFLQNKRKITKVKKRKSTGSYTFLKFFEFNSKKNQWAGILFKRATNSVVIKAQKILKKAKNVKILKKIKKFTEFPAFFDYRDMSH
ncbi:hypothetical protein BpHYR1_043096 [Brachionus plicatilis]|uniref:Uncharacterized protein n=1 Tax=Brachionus plicatilis TaxID=10195 RepID=A0A3M7T2B3_BRAPC|nr:hypothetical protein BpHYR1_043096 [Brachionus plicatilis]